MEGVYINIHFKNYIQHEFELLFDNENSNWWGRGDNNFWARKIILRGTDSIENDPYKQIYYAVKYDRKDLKAYVELKIENTYDGENFDELIDELKIQCPDNDKFQWKDKRTLRWHNVVNGRGDSKYALSEIINYTKEPIENFFRKEKIDGQFEKCPVELNNSQEEVYLETLTLQQLLSLNLVIPDYQRIYCWDEKTIRTLWDDIQEISDSEQYRLGTIILQKKKDSYDIIDGQQRLVTLSLFLSELHIKGISLLQQQYQSLLAEKYIAYNKFFIGNLLTSVRRNNRRKLAEKLWSRIEFNVLILNDSSIDLAYTFFSNENSRGKALSDFDLLKAHHLRFVTDNQEQSMHLAKKWDKMILKAEDTESNAEKDYIRTLSIYIYRLRHWIRNNTWDNNTKYRVKREYEAAPYIPEIPPFGERFHWNESIQGGTHFFGFVETMRSQFKSFTETSSYKAIHGLDTETHWWYRDVIESLLFGYYLKFGETYLADALLLVAKYISLHRFKNGKANFGKLLQYASDSEIIMMIDRATSPTFFLAELLRRIRETDPFTAQTNIQKRYQNRLYKCLHMCISDVEIDIIANLYR